MSRYIIFSLAGWKKSNHIFEEGALRILKTIRFDIAAVGFTKWNLKKRRINQTMWEEDRGLSKYS